nr:MAG TPA: hypothetical protein [Caudoviricetes sp.]
MIKKPEETPSEGSCSHPRNLAVSPRRSSFSLKILI